MRALTTHGLHHRPEERTAVLAELRRRRDDARRVGANYWVFEDRAAPGVMIEFLEASDATLLQQVAHDMFGADRAPSILSEVEF